MAKYNNFSLEIKQINEEYKKEIKNKKMCLILAYKL